MNPFIRAKHWHLFMIMFAIPTFLSIGTYVIMLVQMVQQPFDNPYDTDPFAMFDVMSNMMIGITVISLISTIAVYGWYWSIGTGLQSKLPEGMTMKMGRFKGLAIASALCTVLILVIYTLMLNSMESMMVEAMNSHSSEPPEGIITFVVATLFMMPLSFFVIFAMIHTIFFASKTLKSVELQKEAKFGDFVGEFFLMWFHFIGVWILQPKINRMGSEDWNSPPPIPNQPPQTGFQG